MTHTIYEKLSGRIAKVISCADCDLPLQFDDSTHSAIEGSFSDEKYYFRDGAQIEFPERPSAKHMFDWQTKQWYDPRTLDDLRAVKWTEIKQARAEAIDAPLVTPYGIFDSDAKGRTSITDAVLLANNLATLSLPVAIEFTLADNSVVMLDAAQIVQVGVLLGQKVQYAHPHSQALRRQIEAATTPEQIEAIVW